MKPYDTVLRSMAVFVWLGTAGALAADAPHDAHDTKADDAKAHDSKTHGADSHDSHKTPQKPMALTPAHKAKAAPHKANAPAHSTKAPTPKHGSSATQKMMPAKKVSSHKSPSQKPTAADPAGKVAMAPVPPQKSHAAKWGYDGAGGPAQWGALKSAFKACAAGHRQSPINLEATEPAHLAPLAMHYKVSLIDLVNNGHTVQANYGKGSYITLGNERYDLLQFHFHTPSEHRVAGRSFPMEIHFVHRNKRGQLAVVGVLVAMGDYNLAAREIWDRLPARAHTKSANTRALINARDLLPGATKHFRYSGSLTTPPCSENVNWLVLQTPVRFSEGQIAKLHRIIGMNARPAQARNSRYLLQSIGG